MRQELRRAKRAGCCGMGQGVGFPWELGLLHSLQKPFPSAEWGSGRCSSTSTAGRALGEELSGHLCVPSTPAAPIPAKSFQHLPFSWVLPAKHLCPGWRQHGGDAELCRGFRMLPQQICSSPQGLSTPSGVFSPGKTFTLGDKRVKQKISPCSPIQK